MRQTSATCIFDRPGYRIDIDQDMQGHCRKTTGRTSCIVRCINAKSYKEKKVLFRRLKLLSADFTSVTQQTFII